MNEETLYSATPWFRPFPNPADVFAGNVALHAEHLLPLASVDLSHLARDWSGWLHFVAPVEPVEGVVGEDAGAFHNYLCRENWVGYRITNGKYELATGFGFFRKHRENIPTITGEPKDTDDDLAIHYWNMHAGYREQAARFAQHGCLVHAWAKPGFFGRYKKTDRQPLVQELGGVSRDGNWSNMENFPLRSPGSWTDGDGQEWKLVCPLTEDGRLFTFIGIVSINEYVRPGPDFPGMDADLLLFYDPITQVALTTFDFS